MGRPNTGKTTCLYFLDNPEKYVYFNCDLKKTPFPDKFGMTVSISDPKDLLDYIDDIEGSPDIDGGIIDTISFLMDMYEKQYVVSATNTQKAWGDYGNFYKQVLHKIKSGTKSYIVLAHEDSIINEQTAQIETKVPVKGAVGKTGVESDFTTIVAAKCLPIKKLEAHKNANLNITEEEKEDGSKRVFMTRINKDTSGEKMRSPMRLWSRDELYIDNNIQIVLNRLQSYYA